MAEIVDLPIIIKTNHYGPLEDIHMMIGHLVAASVASSKHAEISVGKNGKVKKNKAVPFHLD